MTELVLDDRVHGLLELAGVGVRTGCRPILDGVSLAVDPGELVAVIGPTGSGRATLLDAIGGLVPLATGTVRLGGRDVTRSHPAERVRHGLGRTFRTATPLPAATVLEAVALAARLAAEYPLRLALSAASVPRAAAARERLRRVLEATRLAELAGHPVAGLPLAYRRRLDLARALASGPRLLLLEHPWEGLGRAERLEHATMLHELSLAGMTLLLVEDDVGLAAELATRVLVMERGRIVADGAPDAVGGTPAARRAMAGRMRA